MMKWRHVFAAALALSLVVVACGGDDEGGGTTGTGPDTGGEPVTLDFWVFEEGGIGSFLKTLEQDFETEHLNVDINITAYPEGNYGVKVDTAIAAGKAPDLVLVFDRSRCAPDCCCRSTTCWSRTASIRRRTCRRS